MNETLNPSPSVGSLLRQTREDLGLTLRDLAAVTKIQSSMLQCLEEDRFEEFPAEVFCRGFLKSYARELHLDEQDILEAYLAQRGLLRATPVVVAPAPSLPNRAAWNFAEPGKLGRIAYVGAVAALVIGLVLSVLVMGAPTDNASASVLPAGTWGGTWNAAPASQSSWGSYGRN
jgi:cytoskeletal protein RodZ